MNKIKIMHIAQANGGVERYLSTFFETFNNERYKHCLIVSKEYKKNAQKFKNLNVRLYFVDMKRNINILKDIESSIEIYKIIKKENPQIVYTHSSKAGGLGRIPAKALGCINIYNPHGWAFDMNISILKKMIFKNIERMLANITDKIVAISDYEKQIAIENSICKKEKINLIENGINVKKIDKTRNLKKDLNWQNKIIIGMVARISSQKSPETFIKIALELLKINDNFRFIIVGDGEERLNIEQKIKDENIEDKILITGWVDNPEEYIQNFDVALLTSAWEGFGLVIPEYMLYKKPVVASNVGGISNIIDNNIDGFLIDNLNVSEFIDKILLLIENLEKRNLIINNAFNKVINKYNFNRVVEQHIKVFEDCLK